MLSPNFRLLNSPTLRVVVPKHGLIDFRTISEEKALQLFKAGFKHVGITTAGAKEYFSKANSNELVELIKSRTDLDDVLILAKLKNTKAVREAKQMMVEQLAD